MALAAGTYAVFTTTEGKITVRLFETEAPITVKNFIELAEGAKEWAHPTSRVKSKDKLYDGTIFHRVIPDFMIQGGDPTGTGMGGPGYRFQDETKGSPHRFDKPGKLAMANSGPGTNGCQFFITVAPTPHLTGNHTIFGEVVEGQDIATKISLVKTAAQDKPIKPVVLESVSIVVSEPGGTTSLWKDSPQKHTFDQLEAGTSPPSNSPQAVGGRTKGSGGSWELLPMSGLITGVVMAISRAHTSGALWLLPTGLAYGFCILNSNFRFSALQKVIGTGIALAIGTYGQQILAMFFAGKH